MSRETQRQINRLKRLANFIKNNPEKYVHYTHSGCLVGLGIRLKRNKLLTIKEMNAMGNSQKVFAKVFGFSEKETIDIYVGEFERFDRKFRDNFYDSDVEEAVKFLNFLAQRKEKELQKA